MKVELNENMDKLFTLMEQSNFLPLKKFVVDVRSFKAQTRIKSKSACVYPGYKKEYNFSDHTVVYSSQVKINEKEDGSYIISSYNNVDTKKLSGSTLNLSGNECSLTVIDGKFKENYTFKFTSKKIHSFKEIKTEKTK